MYRLGVDMRHAPRLRLWLTASLCFLLAGCSNDTTMSFGAVWTTYSYQWWVPLLAAVAGLGVVVLGISVRNRPGWNGWPIAIIGVFIALVMSTGVYRTYARVNDQGFVTGTGLWSTTPEKIEFDNIRSVRVAHEQQVSSYHLDLFNAPTEVLYIYRKTGGKPVRFEIANDVDRAAGNEILKLIERRRIPIHWAPGTRYYFFNP